MLTRYHLRAFRKRTYITQSDIGFLLNLPDNSYISRWESGQCKPTIEIILLYHLLFDVPLDSLLQWQKDDLNEDVIVRIGRLLQDLQLSKPTRKVNSRIGFLTSALTRLTS